MKKITRIGVYSIILVLLLSLVSCSSTSEKQVNIVHKNYTEQRLLGNMLGIYLADLGYKTKVTELGGSMLCFEALKSNTANIYAEYTGTAYGAMLKQTEILTNDETYEYVKEEFSKQFGIDWLEPLGFNNTYVLAISKDVAEEYNLKSISDLVKVSSNLIIGSDSEFPNRVDGLIGLKEKYAGLEFKNVKTMDQGLLYQALVNDEIQVVVAYATEGKLAKYNLVNLEDDLHFFPPYDCAYTINQEYAEENPEVVEAVSKLMGSFSDQDMQQYNLLVDEGQSVKDVAKKMLVDRNLLSN